MKRLKLEREWDGKFAISRVLCPNARILRWYCDGIEAGIYTYTNATQSLIRFTMLSFYASCTLPPDRPTKREVLGFMKHKQEHAGARVLSKEIKKEIANELRDHFLTIGKLALPENINR